MPKGKYFAWKRKLKKAKTDRGYSTDFYITRSIRSGNCSFAVHLDRFPIANLL